MTWLDTFKMNVFNSLLQIGPVGVLVDPQVEGVDLPARFDEAHRVLLHLGTNLPIPIPDLEVSIEGVRATLSFERDPFKISFPWKAVLAAGLTGSELFCQFHEGTPVEVKPEGPAPESKEDPEPPKPEGGQLIPFLIPGGVGDN